MRVAGSWPTQYHDAVPMAVMVALVSTVMTAVGIAITAVMVVMAAIMMVIFVMTMGVVMPGVMAA